MKKYLSASDVLRQQQAKQSKRQEAFEIILDQCYKKIQKCIQVTRNVFECFYEIPEFIIGYPLYDLSECTVYCYNLLINKGFQVQYIFPRVLFISWKPIVKTNSALPMPSVHSGHSGHSVPSGPSVPSTHSHVPINATNATSNNPSSSKNVTVQPKKFVQRKKKGGKIILDLS